MIRLLTWFFMAVLFSGCFSVVAHATSNSYDTTAKALSPAIQLEKDTLIVGSEQDYPPFATGMTESTAGGFTVELWKAVAAEADLKYTLRVRPFHQILQEFKHGKIDVLINLAQSHERHQFADFSIPHVVVHGAIFVRKGETRISTEEDLADKSIIVLNADLAHDYAAAKGLGKNLVLVETAAEGFRLLASGKHDAILISKLVGMQTLQALGFENIKALKNKAGFSQKFAFAVPEGQSELLAKINEGLVLKKSDGTYNKLYEKWFGIFESKEVGLADLLKYLIPIIAIFLCVLVYFLYQRQKERYATEIKLRTLYAAIEQSQISVVITDADANIQYINPHFSEVTGYSPKDVIGQNPRILRSGRTPQAKYEEMWNKLTSGQVWQGELLNKRKNGEIYFEEAHIAPVKNQAGVVTHYVAAKVDITQRKSAEATILESRNLLSTIIDTVPLRVFWKDKDLRYLGCNTIFAKDAGRNHPKDVIGKDDYQMCWAAQAEFYRADDRAVMESGVAKLFYEEPQTTPNGQAIWLSTSKIPLVNQNNETIGVLGIYEDITERKNMHEMVEHLAHYDQLTDLPNRTLFNDRLRQALAVAKREKYHLALIFVDLDKFKPINDIHGHHIGDLMLNEVGKRIQYCLRESDTVARIGGDEFIVLLPIIETEQDALGVAEKIRHSLNQPFELVGHSLEISSSIGISIYPAHGTDEKSLINSADIAMYYAKRIGRNNSKVYNIGVK